MPLTSTFPDTLFTVFAGDEGMHIFSSNHATEPEAMHQIETLRIRHPLTSFGFAKYTRVVEADAEVT